IEITDAAGRKVAVSENANLILVLCQTEVIRVLQADDRVVAVNRWVAQLHCSENPVICHKPVIGGFGPGDVNYERIIEIADSTEGEDVVLTYDKPWADDMENKLAHIDGIKVVKLNLFISENFEEELKTLARMLGREDQCTRYLSWRDSLTGEVSRRLREAGIQDMVQVFWSSSAKGGYKTSNREAGAGRVIHMAGGINIAADLPLSSVRVSPEWIVSKDPDVIISHAAFIRHVSGMELGYDFELKDTAELAGILKEFAGLPGIDKTGAAKNNRIHFICDDLMFGPMQPIGALYLARWFYPSVFRDIDPKKEIEKFYTSFMNLTPEGIFVYTEK
ncbi:MAG: ABC transporter substrate-binding protein, partial [Bacteroidales bacterium]